uniref:DUF1771 domain-containing protein n=1 Tax=Kalanchoe fedtschenkoi TaxID=63787 RepID=A0A7N0ZQB4_KALFE
MSFPSCSSSNGHKHAEVEELERLLDAFGSMFSLEDISSAYWEAKRDVTVTGEILFTRIGSHGRVSDEVELAVLSSLESPYRPETSKSMLIGQLNERSLNKGKKLLGEEYARSGQPTSRPLETSNPNKIHSTNLQINESASNKDVEIMSEGVRKMHRDVEDFVFQMLGRDFHLDMNVIRAVLGQCGYDVSKGIERLLDISASTLEKSDDVISSDAANPSRSTRIEMEYSLAQPSHRSMDASKSKSKKRNNNLQGAEKEVLLALFSAPSIQEQKPEYCPLSKRRQRSRSGAFGTPVAAPPETPNNFRRTVTMESKITDGDTDEGEHSFEVLRQAVKEYWVTMKEYFKAAVEAFSDGDLVRATKLLEQGHVFSERAKEADARSAEMLFRARFDTSPFLFILFCELNNAVWNIGWTGMKTCLLIYAITSHQKQYV